MQIGRFAVSTGGAPFWGRVDGDEVIPLNTSLASICGTVRRGGQLSENESSLALRKLKILAPADPTSRVFAVGFNYAPHAQETGYQVPSSPVAFLKPYSSLADPNEDIVLPAITERWDYEVELVAVIGCSSAEPHRHSVDCIFGYTVGNDFSARDLQFRTIASRDHLDFFAGKIFDRSAPLGPMIVTRDEIESLPSNLELTLDVNGERRQAAHARDMIFDVNALLGYFAGFTALQPGDLIFTGTPNGVAMSSGRYLLAGDEVLSSITGIGELRNRIVASKSPR